MKRVIKASAGDISLSKFIFVKMDKLAEYPFDYDSLLGGYLYIWSYTYNTLTHQTDDRVYAHADVIDTLPSDIRWVFKTTDNGCWGKTDWYQDRKRFYCNNPSVFNDSQLKHLQELCGMKDDGGRF